MSVKEGGWFCTHWSAFLSLTMEWCSLTDLKDSALWQKDGGRQHSGSGNLYCACACSHERIGDHLTKPKCWWLKRDCINTPYAASIYMLLYMLYIYAFHCDFFLYLHLSCENKIKLTRWCRETPLTECFLICNNQINKREAPTKLHLI